MYTNIYHDAYSKKMYLWEIDENGKKKKTIHNMEYEYFVSDKNGKYKDIYGVPVTKRTTTDKKSVKELKYGGVYTCETDLLEEMKFLYKTYKDVELKPNMSKINVAFVDIEVATENEFPKPEQAKYPINLITIKFSNTGELHTFGTKEYTGDNPVVKNYYYYANEIDMLEAFVKLFRKSKVDIVTGWNSSEYLKFKVTGFDIPYIINRMAVLGIDKSLSPINKTIKSNRTPNGYTIAGISLLDYMALYIKFTKDKKESYSLEYICQDELKEGKSQYEGSIIDFWKNDWNKFVEYNIQDVLLIEKLEEKLKYIELMMTLGYESLNPFEKIFSSISTLTGYIYKTLHDENMVMPDKKEKEDEDFPGAYVFAKKGFYEQVISFDVESLYPHEILTYNISPETLVFPGTDRYDRLKENGNLISTPLDGIYYDKSIKGVVPKVIEKIFAERKKFKRLNSKYAKEKNKDLEKYYDRQQYIRKILINSLYGVLGNRYFHFYDINNAKAVTFGGQHLIKFLSSSTRDYFKNFFHKDKKYFKTIDENNKLKKDTVILIDTDSTYFHLKEIKEKIAPDEDFLTWAQKFEKEFFKPFFFRILKIYCKKFNTEQKINFEREKIISKQLILAKKKYATEVLDDEGTILSTPELKITGIEIVRTSTPSFCRSRIKRVIEKIFETQDKDVVLDFMKQIKNKFKKEDITNIAFPRGVSDYKKYASKTKIKSVIIYPLSCPIHVRAAINFNYLNKKFGLKNRNISDGSKIKFIYIKENNILNTNIIGFMDKYPEKFKELFDIDYDLQWEKAFQAPIQSFFDVLGWGTINFNNRNLNKFISF